MGTVDTKVIIGACIMKTTLENIGVNSMPSTSKKCGGGYFRISGKAAIHPSGKYLNIAISRSKPPMPTRAVTVTIEEANDVGNGREIP